MDSLRFDRLSRALAAHGPRRGVLGLLALVPVVGGLSGILSPEETEAAGRRKRRKRRHTRRSGDDKKNRKGKHRKKPRCTLDSVTQTCAGKCGTVTNNCQQTVNCGSCTCNPPCAACFTCQDGPNTPGTCVVDRDQVGDACGSAGQVCQANGTCACTASSCPDCTTCEGNGQCAPCADCCDTDGVCQDGNTNTACGTSGICAVCTAPKTCGGGSTARVCGCTPTTCAAQGKNCGTILDGCGNTLECGQCTGFHQSCGGGGTPNVCGCRPDGTVVTDRLLCCSDSCCRDELPAGQCRCAGGCG